MSQPTVLVTGAPGWLGTRLVESLTGGLPEVRGLESPIGADGVRCLVHQGTDGSSLKKISNKIGTLDGDITSQESVEAFFDGAEGATVFHCAGLIHPTRGLSQLASVNVDGTRTLLAGAVKAGVRRFIHVSSNSPIGTNSSPGDLFDEASPYHPYMEYGRTKMLAEELVNEAGKAGKLQTVIIRPPWFYGINQPARQTLFFSMVKNGKAPIVGDGENRRSMAYVDNICQGLLLCAKTEQARGQTYWIADRSPYTMNAIVGTIERVLETDFKIPVTHKRLRLPGFASEVALLADRMIQGVGLYHQKLHVLSEMNKTIACSIDKATRELGYDPKIDLEEGMRRSIQWVINQGQTI